MLNLDDNVRVVQTASFAFLVVLLAELIINFIVQVRVQRVRAGKIASALDAARAPHASCVAQGAGKGNTDKHNTTFHTIPAIGDNFTQVPTAAAVVASRGARLHSARGLVRRGCARSSCRCLSSRGPT
jgi:hypothetical protein